MLIVWQFFLKHNRSATSSGKLMNESTSVKWGGRPVMLQKKLP